MKIASVKEFKKNAQELLDALEKDQDILIISRRQGQEALVVLPISQYEAFKETSHLLSTSANTGQLNAKYRSTQGRQSLSVSPRTNF